MELHKAIKEIVARKGNEIICNPQIINYLVDYQAFKDLSATKLILKTIIESRYAESLLALTSDKNSWEIKNKQYLYEFINTCGFKEEWAAYVFDSLAYGLSITNVEPTFISYKKYGNNERHSSEHIDFIGIPLGENIYDIIQKLKEKGFSVDEKYKDWENQMKMGTGNSVTLNGKLFEMDNCLLYLMYTRYSHLVHTISVVPSYVEPSMKDKDWETLKTQYMILKGKLISKYGEPSFCQELFAASYYDGCGNEIEGLNKSGCEFELPGGYIDLNIYGLIYNDKVNSDINREENQ